MSKAKSKKWRQKSLSRATTWEAVARAVGEELSRKLLKELVDALVKSARKELKRVGALLRNRSEKGPTPAEPISSATETKALAARRKRSRNSRRVET